MVYFSGFNVKDKLNNPESMDEQTAKATAFLSEDSRRFDESMGIPNVFWFLWI